jgi:hypothetical protein
MSEMLEAALPPSLKARAEAADKMIRDMAEAAKAAQAAPAPTPAPDAQPTPAPAPEAPATPAPAPAPAPDAQPTPAPAPVPQDALARAEQDARTWRGRFEAAERDRRALEASLADLRASVETLRTERTAQAAPAPAAEHEPLVQPTMQALSPKELDDFGPDLMDAVARHAVHSVAPLIEAAVKRAMDKIQGELGSLRATTDSVKQTAQLTVDERFVANLNAGLKNWQAVDTDPAFLAWLREYDPLIGRARKESLDDATASRDSDRVLAFFRAFLNQQGGSAPRSDQPSPGSGAAEAPGIQPAAPAATTPPVSLEDLAAPGQARTAEPVAPTGKRVWKLSEIRLHAQKIARGLYTDPAEKDRIDREIALAQREGRVSDG